MRFKVGVGLLVLYVIMLLSVAVIGVLPLELGAKVATVSAVLVSSEVVFLLGVIGIGKEAYQALKAKFHLKKAPR